MRRLMFAIMTVVALAIVGCDHYDAPTSIRNTFSSEYPSAVDVEWKKRHDYVVAEFYLPGQGECEAWYTKAGEWVMTSYDIAYSDLPSAVRNAFESAYGSETPVDDVERLVRNNNDTIYFIEATVVVNGFLTDIYLDYSEDGTLLRTTINVEDYDYLYYYL